MNILQKIEQAFNKHKVEEIENVYTPKIQKSVIPKKSSFNEVYKNARNQTNKIYNVNK